MNRRGFFAAIPPGLAALSTMHVPSTAREAELNRPIFIIRRGSRAWDTVLRSPLRPGSVLPIDQPGDVEVAYLGKARS